MAIWCGLSPTAGIIDELPSGRLYKDGSLLVEADARMVADRRRLSFAGMVSVALALTDKGELVDDPSLDLIGIPERDRDGGLIYEAVHDAVIETLAIAAARAPPRSRRGGGGGPPRRARRGQRALGQKADMPCARLGGMMNRHRVYPMSALTMPKSAKADLG